MASEWLPKKDGPIDKAYVAKSFTEEELIGFGASDADTIPASLYSSGALLESVTIDNATQLSLETRKTLVWVVLAWTQGRAGGVILGDEKSDKGPRFLGVEFYDTQKNPAGNPLVKVKYTIAPTRKQARAFVREELVEYRECDGRVMTAVVDLFHSCGAKSPYLDGLSRTALYEANLTHISPTKAFIFQALSPPTPPPAPNPYPPTDVSAYQSATYAKGNYSATLSIGSSGVVHTNEPTLNQEVKGGKCPVCFAVAAKKCDGCKVTYYCCRDHQLKHWKTHKKQCAEARKASNDSQAKAKALYKDLTSDKESNASRGEEEEQQQQSKPKIKLPPALPMAMWSNGLGNRQYEWLVDCYRMRVDDDCTHGNGKRHGLYLAGASDIATQSLLRRACIGLDFLLFVKLCQEKGAIPQLDWDYSELLKVAPRLLSKPFSKQGDAIRKYGGENVFDVANGGRSLRYTGEHIYGTNILNPGYSLDAAYLRIKSEIHKVVQPIKIDFFQADELRSDLMMVPVKDLKTDAALNRLMGVVEEIREKKDGGGEEESEEMTKMREDLEALFLNVGGLEEWRAMISAIHL